MKISAWVTVSDLISTNQTLFEKVYDLIDNKQTMFHQLSHDYIFQSLKKAGVDGMELLIPLYTTDDNLKEIKKIITKNDMPVLSVHQSLTSMLNINIAEIIRLCSIARLFSAKVITLHAGSLNKKLFDKRFINTLNNLQKEYSITFTIENMQRYPFPFPNPSYTYEKNEFITILKDTGLSVTFDTTHLAQVGDDITSFYLANKNVIKNIHFSDYKKSWLNTNLHFPDNMHLALGTGNLPIKSFVKTLKKEDYRGLITMEINTGLEGLCRSAKLIRSYYK